jgi:photosystem II stability/assembly factor-like uncharacterized protein
MRRSSRRAIAVFAILTLCAMIGCSRSNSSRITTTSPTVVETPRTAAATATVLFENVNRELALNGEPTLAPGTDPAPFTHDVCPHAAPPQLVGASFITPLEGWIVASTSAGYEVWHTPDTRRWGRVSTLDFEVQHITFRDPTHGVVVGVRHACSGVDVVDDPVGAFTTDAGQTWREIETPGAATDLAFVGTRLRIHTHVCAEPCLDDSRPNYEAEYVSDDDGASWRAVPRPTDTHQPCERPFPAPGKVYWLDTATAWESCSGAAGRKQLFHTSDGGNTWTLFSEFIRGLPETPPAGVGELPGSEITVMLFRNSNDGWMGTEERGKSLRRSRDGGRSWSPVNEEIDLAARSIAFIDASDGFVVTTNSLWRTTDGGDTWQPIRSPLP